MDWLLPLAKSIPVAFAALLPVINPLGTAIILLSLTEGASDATRKQLARAVAVNTTILLLVLLRAGSYLLSFFGISVPIVQTAGGFVLASMGWNLLNQQTDSSETKSVTDRDERSFAAKTFYPFTFPITVGPGGVAVALTLSAHTTDPTLSSTLLGKAGACLGILGNAIVVYFAFAYSNRIASRLGPTGLSVMMRLIAFIVVCIGAEISWTGIQALIAGLPHS